MVFLITYLHYFNILNAKKHFLYYGFFSKYTIPISIDQPNIWLSCNKVIKNNCKIFRYINHAYYTFIHNNW